MRRYAALSAVALLLLTAGCVLTPPPASARTPPIYPGARYVVVQPSEGYYEHRQTITYQCPATPDQVARFYQTELAKDGWDFPGGQPSLTHLYFTWFNGNRNASNFGLELWLTATTHLSEVRLLLTEALPLD